MLRVRTEARDGSDVTKFGDSASASSSPLKKPKTDTEPENRKQKEIFDEQIEKSEGNDVMDHEPNIEAEVAPKPRFLRDPNWDDPVYQRQLKLFQEQYEKYQVYDFDWDKLDFIFDTLKLEDGPCCDLELSNRELVEMLIKTAIDRENERCESELEFVKYVSANVQCVAGFLFFTTFWATDPYSENQQPELYQAKLRKFGDELVVYQFRLRPTQELPY